MKILNPFLLQMTLQQSPWLLFKESLQMQIISMLPTSSQTVEPPTLWWQLGQIQGYFNGPNPTIWKWSQTRSILLILRAIFLGFLITLQEQDMEMYLGEWMLLQGQWLSSNIVITFLYKWLLSPLQALITVWQELTLFQVMLFPLFILEGQVQWIKVRFIESMPLSLQILFLKTFTLLVKQNLLITLHNLDSLWPLMNWLSKWMHFQTFGISKYQVQIPLVAIMEEPQWARALGYFSFGKRQQLLRTAKDFS